MLCSPLTVAFADLRAQLRSYDKASAPLISTGSGGEAAYGTLYVYESAVSKTPGLVSDL